jgi:hypothetical protein
MTDDEDVWKELLEEEAALRQQMHATNQYADEAPDIEANRAWWACAAKVLMRYRWALETSPSPSPLPIGMVAFLHVVALHFSTGNVAEFVELVVAANRPKDSPLKTDYIGWATAYLRLVKEGVILNKHHTKTVSEAYGVTKPTVQKWAQAELPDDFSLLPDLLRRPDYVERRMRESGEYYRRVWSVADRQVLN